MLDDYKLIFKKEADAYLPKEWDKLNKNVLCNLYIENEKESKLKDAYYCAIVYRYWGLIQKFYSLSYNVCSPEDVYEWLLSSITYALRHRSWKKESSSIYNDPNGPDKVINRCMKCRRLTYYQAINRKKRKNGNLMLSLDKMKEDFNDNTDTFEDIDSAMDNSSIALISFIRQLFLNQEYFTAFVVDSICFAENIFDDVVDEDETIRAKFNPKALVKVLFEINETYLQAFATRYDLDYEKVLREWDKYIYRDPERYEAKIIESLDYLSTCNYLEDTKPTDFTNKSLQNIFIKPVKQSQEAKKMTTEELW